MGEWINICNVNDLKNNTIKKFTVKETEILIARTESNFYAFSKNKLRVSSSTFVLYIKRSTSAGPIEDPFFKSHCQRCLLHVRNSEFRIPDSSKGSSIWGHIPGKA